MKYSKQWLKEATKLCAELDSEDGIDQRYLIRSQDKKTKQHKNRQLCKQATRILSLVLSGELGDKKLQDLEIVDVLMSEDRQFLNILIKNNVSHPETNENLILGRLHAIQGYLRFELAQSVKRKRIPMLKFKWAYTLL